MAIQTNGFGNSSFDDVSWAQTSALTGGPFRVADSAAWRPSVVAGVDRTVSIAAGLAVACGVRALNTAAVRVAFAANSGAGVRRDALVARFDWAARTVTFRAVTGSSLTPAVVTTAVDPNQLDRIHRIPGVLYDAMIAMVNVYPGTGGFAPDVASDLRPYGGIGGPLLFDGGEYTDMVDALPGAELRATGTGYRWTRTGGAWVRSAPSGSVLASPAGAWVDLPNENASSSNEVWGADPQVLAEWTITDPRVPYEVEVAMNAEIRSTQESTRWDATLNLDSITGPELGKCMGGRWINGTNAAYFDLRALRTNRRLTGQHKVLVVARAGFKPAAGAAFGLITPFNRRLEARVFAA